jgi:hypothetical protein
MNENETDWSGDYTLDYTVNATYAYLDALGLSHSFRALTVKEVVTGERLKALYRRKARERKTGCN